MVVTANYLYLQLIPSSMTNGPTVRLKYCGNYKSIVPGYTHILWEPNQIRELPKETADILFNEGRSLFEIVPDEPKHHKPRSPAKEPVEKGDE